MRQSVIIFYRSAIFYEIIIAAGTWKSKAGKPKAFLRLRLRNNKVAKQKQKQAGKPSRFSYINYTLLCSPCHLKHS